VDLEALNGGKPGLEVLKDSRLGCSEGEGLPDSVGILFRYGVGCRHHDISGREPRTRIKVHEGQRIRPRLAPVRGYRNLDTIKAGAPINLGRGPTGTVGPVYSPSPAYLVSAPLR
jgi:hypothetical protein